MESDEINFTKDTPYPWYTFVSPNLFDGVNDKIAKKTLDLSTKTALGLELMVLLAKPQPSWASVVKVRLNLLKFFSFHFHSTINLNIAGTLYLTDKYCEFLLILIIIKKNY